ncbi:VacJ family lipoprotein [Coraliomargarita sp. SDUM461004]|uniref:VacJ family lipoprotein n=1 Tax=Thalassobacterium sedimentorum TaxID=3041258 RepID=A0ABU1AIP7_9BACT|nr:VacJ family lipoprotein [Coraliomargarita sp. SDUM461004]MDQ8194670.1 VacJ family lipoprotein [Coraliomargarita sp. SDUM461004]
MKIRKFKSPLTWTALFSLVTVSAFAAQGAQGSAMSDEDFYNEEVVSATSIYDPFEGMNRYTFEFNDYVYMKVLQPIVDGYTAITPDPVETGASNFFRNLKYPVRLVGNLLQGRMQGAWVETGRFVVNSTVGVAGIMTPADSINGLAPIKPEDIGQALGSWGIGEGPYLVLPLLGPSNLRDLGGMIGDRAVNPLKEPFSLIDDWRWESHLALSGTEFIVKSPDILERYKQFKGSAIDPYSSMKNGFTQYRRGAIAE